MLKDADILSVPNTANVILQVAREARRRILHGAVDACLALLSGARNTGVACSSNNGRSGRPSTLAIARKPYLRTAWIDAGSSV